jgi:transmembrane 9 superfamily member 3
LKKSKEEKKMKMLKTIALVAVVLLIAMQCVRGDLDAHRYERGEEVILWVNKIGPYRNPQETYFYYSLPFCQPKEYIESDHNGLGESLQSYELTMSPLEIQFAVNAPEKVLCTKKLSVEEAQNFEHAVDNQYWYQLFIDDLPIWGMVGEILDHGHHVADGLDDVDMQLPGASKKTASNTNNDNKKKRSKRENSQLRVGGDGAERQVLLYTHKRLSLSYNGDRVIAVNLTNDRPVRIEAGVPITFTYSVQWEATDVLFEDRFDRYLDSPFFEHQIHFFSIFNSFMMVVFLVGLVSMILMRTLKKDYARFGVDLGSSDHHGHGRSSSPHDSESGGDLLDVGDESGWKQVHGDVFRPPPHLALFSALLGTGHQLVLLVFSVLLLSMVGAYYRNRGTVVTAFVVCYAFTSFVAGYAGGGYYARNGGRSWKAAMMATATLFPGVCFAAMLVLNAVAVSYGSLASISFGTVAFIVLLWALISLPLTIVGTVLGKNWNGEPDNPCAVKKLPRQIPERPWYLRCWLNIVLGGVLPFGSIFIEMYFIFTSFWHYKYYYVYSFLMLVFAILIVVTVCVTIVSTYFLLNAEDYRWKWTSFLSAASTAAYVFLYAVYFFFFKTHMSGFLQTAFYFLYTSLFCFGLAILTGSIGYVGTAIFIRRIFRAVKIE